MNKELKYSGYSAQPSDYESPDGDLAYSFNLVNENGASGPIGAPEVLFEIEAGWQIFLHVNGVFRHIIAFKLSDGQTCVRMLAEDGTPVSGNEFIIPDEACDVKGFGNMIVFAGQHSLHYLYWKAAADSYSYLGTRIPDIRLDFGLLSSVGCMNTGEGISIVSSDAIQNTSWNAISTIDLNRQPVTAPPASLGGYNTSVCTAVISFPASIVLENSSEYRFSVSFPGMRVQTDYYSIVVRLFTGNPGNAATTDGLIVEAVPVEQNKCSVSFVANGDCGALSFAILFYAKSQFSTGITEVSANVSLEKGLRQHIEGGSIIEYSSASYNAVAGAINRFIAQESIAKDRFIYPFFVRYAVRLYDGSYVRTSPLILMVPNSGYVPLIYYRQMENPRSDDPLGQVDLTPWAKIELPL